MANKVEHTIIELYVENECVKNWVVHYLFEDIRAGDVVDDTYLCLPGLNKDDGTLYRVIGFSQLDGVKVIKMEYVRD